MKIYVAKHFENNKGIWLEGFRYRKVDNEYKGIYCKYFIKNGNYDKDSINLDLLSDLPINVSYDETTKKFVIPKSV